MSFSGYNMTGGVHTCYPFYERLLSCVQRESLPIKMCSLEGEDFLECINRRKQVISLLMEWLILTKYALNYKIAHELRKFKILSIPKYDMENDTFIVSKELPDANKFFGEKEKVDQAQIVAQE